MNKDLIKQIAFLGGTIVIFVAGLIYNICGDLVIGAASTWLFGSILLAFGSGICAVFSDRCKEKPKAYFALKGIAVGLAVGFIVLLIVFQAVVVPGLTMQKDRDAATAVDVVSIVVSVVALAALILDLVLSVLDVKDDIRQEQIAAAHIQD